MVEEKRGEKGVDTINSLVSNFILMINFSFPTCKSTEMASKCPVG